VGHILQQVSRLCTPLGLISSLGKKLRTWGVGLSKSISVFRKFGSVLTFLGKRAGYIGLIFTTLIPIAKVLYQNFTKTSQSMENLQKKIEGLKLDIKDSEQFDKNKKEASQIESKKFQTREDRTKLLALKKDQQAILSERREREKKKILETDPSLEVGFLDSFTSFFGSGKKAEKEKKLKEELDRRQERFKDPESAEKFRKKEERLSTISLLRKNFSGNEISNEFGNLITSSVLNTDAQGAKSNRKKFLENIEKIKATAFDKDKGIDFRTFQVLTSENPSFEGSDREFTGQQRTSINKRGVGLANAQLERLIGAESPFTKSINEGGLGLKTEVFESIKTQLADIGKQEDKLKFLNKVFKELYQSLDKFKNSASFSPELKEDVEKRRRVKAGEDELKRQTLLADVNLKSSDLEARTQKGSKSQKLFKKREELYEQINKISESERIRRESVIENLENEIDQEREKLDVKRNVGEATKKELDTYITQLNLGKENEDALRTSLINIFDIAKIQEEIKNMSDKSLATKQEEEKKNGESGAAAAFHAEKMQKISEIVARQKELAEKEEGYLTEKNKEQKKLSDLSAKQRERQEKINENLELFNKTLSNELSGISRNSFLVKLETSKKN